jgi:hypothetical protein
MLVHRSQGQAHGGILYRLENRAYAGFAGLPQPYQNRVLTSVRHDIFDEWLTPIR